MTATISRSRRIPYLFQAASLRFGVHGIGGLVCVVLTESCRQQQLQQQQQQQQHNMATQETETSSSSLLLLSLLCVSQVLNFSLVTHANTLLPQVPNQTAILPWIVAPHKEAFRRTIGMMQYLVVRILCRVSCQTWQLNQRLALYGTCGCLALPYARLVPWTLFAQNGNLGNGNTWIFVLPIWLGTTGDLWQMIQWGDLISVAQLLQVEMVGLGLAFGFTLAFRNIVPMPIVYAVAAWRVWEILREGTLTIKAG
eukprot:scaffold4884_cov165-Amphora_coffeaeformis.AAC.5